MKKFNPNTKFDNAEEVKERLVLRFTSSNKDFNRLPDNIVALNYLNFKMPLYLITESNNEVIKSYPVTFDMLKQFNISKDEAFKIAKNNMNDIYNTQISKITDLLKSLISDEEASEVLDDDYDPPFYVFTNEDKIYGAANLVNENALNEIYNKVGQNCYILPSSVHEVILVPENHYDNADELMAMVQNVNATEVEESEFLANDVYYYNHDEQTVKSMKTGIKEKSFDNYFNDLGKDVKEVELNLNEDKTPDETSPKL